MSAEEFWYAVAVAPKVRVAVASEKDAALCVYCVPVVVK